MFLPPSLTIISNFYGYVLSVAGGWALLLAVRVSRKVQPSQPWLALGTQKQVSNRSTEFRFLLLVLFFPKLYLHQSLNLSEFNKHILMFFCWKELKTRHTRAAVSFFSPAERGG